MNLPAAKGAKDPWSRKDRLHGSPSDGNAHCVKSRPPGGVLQGLRKRRA
jgi:hypothetical protein